MNIRSVNSANSMRTTANFAKQQALGNTGGIFVGGKGIISVSNTTDGFQCAGGESTMNLINQGNMAKIQLGTGALGSIGKTDTDGKAYYVKNDVISVGQNCYINGSSDADVILSIGQNCAINFNDGANMGFVSGEGTTVNNGKDNDKVTGTPAGLDYASLMSLDIISMAAKINQYLSANPSQLRVF